jgi:hypothetical protein
MNKLFLQLLRQAKAGGFPARNPAPTSFPFDNPLTLLGAKGRYFQRQAQGGIDAARGLFGKVQGFGPTALNPLRTSTPTTLLGKAGKFINPLNPLNAVGYGAALAVDNLLPERMRGTATTALLTPGGLPAKVLAGGLYDMFLNPNNAGVGLGDGTLEANSPELIPSLRRFRANQAQTQQRPIGTIATLGGNEVSWQGDRWQRTYSEGASPPSAPAPGSPQNLFSGRQAGQVGSNGILNVISNGAGVPAQKPNVVNRALPQEVLNAAQQFGNTANISLPSFYEGQQQLGRSMMQKGTLVSQLQELGGAPGMTPENLKIWAEKNPALAYRELLKLKERAS